MAMSSVAPASRQAATPSTMVGCASSMWAWRTMGAVPRAATSAATPATVSFASARRLPWSMRSSASIGGQLNTAGPRVLSALDRHRVAGAGVGLDEQERQIAAVVGSGAVDADPRLGSEVPGGQVDLRDALGGVADLELEAERV